MQKWDFQIKKSLTTKIFEKKNLFGDLLSVSVMAWVLESYEFVYLKKLAIDVFHQDLISTRPIKQTPNYKT